MEPAQIKTELVARLSGRTMIERFTLRGHPIAMDRSEVCNAVIISWWGIGLTGWFFQIQPTAIGVLDDFLPAPVWAVVALASGVSQLISVLCTWLGFAEPWLPLRLATLLIAVCFFTALTVALLISGARIGPMVYVMLAIQSALNYRRTELVAGRIRRGGLV